MQLNLVKVLYKPGTKITQNHRGQQLIQLSLVLTLRTEVGIEFIRIDTVKLSCVMQSVHLYTLKGKRHVRWLYLGAVGVHCLCAMLTKLQCTVQTTLGHPQLRTKKAASERD